MRPRKIIAPRTFEAGFQAIRDELDIPREFPADVLEAAEAATDRFETQRADYRHLRFVAIDPPGARDLDQAFHAERTAAGYRVFYAIADVGAFIHRDDPIDLEARERGTTYYSPDRRTPLHPAVLSEDRASLLPGTDKPSLLWTIDLDANGLPTDAHLERALVRVHEAIDPAVNITTNGNATYFSFAATGLGRGDVAGTSLVSATICDQRGNIVAAGGWSSARVLIVTPIGRATVVRIPLVS